MTLLITFFLFKPFCAFQDSEESAEVVGRSEIENESNNQSSESGEQVKNFLEWQPCQSPVMVFFPYPYPIHKSKSHLLHKAPMVYA